MDRTGKYPDWSNKITKKQIWIDMYLLISRYYPKSSEYLRYNSQITWSSRRRKNNVWILCGYCGTLFLLIGEQSTHGRRYRDKVWGIEWRNAETATPGDPSYIWSWNPDSISDTNVCLLWVNQYSCLPRGSATAWQIQKWIFSDNSCTVHRSTGGPGEGTGGDQGFCTLLSRTTIWTN